jgi:hypothetical protein
VGQETPGYEISLISAKDLKVITSAFGGDYLCFNVFSSETVSFFLPFLLREASTLRPLALAILSRNPCLFFLFLLDG